MERIKDILYRQYYELAFIPYNGLSTIVNWDKNLLRVLKSPKTKWYADPFFRDVTDDRFIVWAEEFRYKERVGRIVQLEIEISTMRILKEVVILENSTHFSFPISYTNQGENYVYPENSLSGELNLYKFNDEYSKLEFQKSILKRKVVDSVIYDCKWGKFLFTTDYSDHGGNGDVLKIFKWENDEFVPFQDVMMPQCYARNAGAILHIDGDDYRVAQDCTRSYGENLIFQKIDFNPSAGFSFRDIAKISPWGRLKGIHTFNVCKDWAVVDLYYDCFPKIRRLYFILTHLMRKS